MVSTSPMPDRQPRDIVYRPVCTEDCAELARLSCQLGYPSDSDQVATRLAGIAGSAPHAVFVAQTPDSLAGWVHVYGRQSLLVAPFAEIGGLVVDSSWRGAGIGKALMSIAEQWAVEHSYSQMRLKSGEGRQEAHQFYAAIGFAAAGRQQVFVKRLGD